jgi:ATP-dependent helicase HrpB
VANIFNDTQKHLVMTRHLENGLSMLPRKVKDLPGIAGLPVLSVLGQMDSALEEKRYLLLAATPIAERSITIQGIRVVVDSSLVNQPKFSPWKTWTVL